MGNSADKQVRERLVARGVGELTDGELVSVLLGEGSEGSALELARKVLDVEGVGGLSRMELGKLRQVAGMGVGRAARLMAAFELGRRVARLEAGEMEAVGSDADVAGIFRPLLGGLQHEEFWVLYLSASNRVMERSRMSQGGVRGTVVDHKLIVKRAVELLSPGLIVVHNHPSGSARPSGADLELTRRLETAASLFDITLLDHVIVTSGEHFSFRKEGLVGKAAK